MNGKDQTLVFVCELTDTVCDVFVLYFFFFSPRSPYDTIRHANISSFHRTFVKTDVLPRLIGFMYCMTEACAQRHKISPSQNQH